jgi:hypothetical protein
MCAYAARLDLFQANLWLKLYWSGQRGTSFILFLGSIFGAYGIFNPGQCFWFCSLFHILMIRLTSVVFMSNILLRLYAVVPHFVSSFIADIVTLLSHSRVLGALVFVCLVQMVLINWTIQKLADNRLFLPAKNEDAPFICLTYIW